MEEKRAVVPVTPLSLTLRDELMSVSRFVSSSFRNDKKTKRRFRPDD